MTLVQSAQYLGLVVEQPQYFVVEIDS